MKAWKFMTAAAAGLGGLFLCSLRPNTKRKNSLRLWYGPVAHRGLFDNRSEAPENSLPAFRRAIEHGFPFELDVQLTKDHRLVVFHDWDLKRMAGVPLKVTEHTYRELCRYTLGKSEERIPLFSEVLRLNHGQVPMIVEIKVGYSHVRETARALACAMKNYHGAYCVECFNPLGLLWYRRHVPDVLRGQLSQDFRKTHDVPRVLAPFVTQMMGNFLSAPDFVSYNYRHTRTFGFRACRHLFHGAAALWTIQSEKALKEAEQEADIFIFDGFIPENRKKNQDAPVKNEEKRL